MSLAIELLLAKLGRPPYSVNQVTMLRDECRALIRAMTAGEAVEKTVAVGMFDLMDQMTLVIYLVGKGGKGKGIKTNQENGSNEAANDELLQSSITMETLISETLEYRQVLLDYLRVPETSKDLCRQYRKITVFSTDHMIGGSILCGYGSLNVERCKLCCYVSEFVSQRWQPSPPQSSLVCLKPHWAESDDRRLLYFELAVISHELGSYTDVCFSVETSNEDIARELGLMGLTGETTLCPSNVRFIQEQFNSLERPITSHSFVPKRLLDLGTNEATDPRLILIGQYETSLEYAQYATLSYCWGEAEEATKQLKLTKDNEEEFGRAIPPEKMTAVLQDAVAVCRLLKIRYLWVDSLCIMQGPKAYSDWEEQSYEMNHIFGNSLLTICAVASSSCTQSFLHHVDRDSLRMDFDLHTEDMDLPQSTLRLRLLTADGRPVVTWSHSHFREGWPLDRDLSSSKWITRGWIYQENALSPRKLYFGPTMVHFQNESRISSENGCDVPASLFRHHLNKTKEYRQVLSHESLRSQHPFIPDVWYRMASDIANIDFTDRADVFPAASGIARVFTEVSRYRYVAGLWEEDLHCGLLWYRDSGSGSSIRDGGPTDLSQLLRFLEHSSAIAPSWSWASRKKPRWSTFRFMLTNEVDKTSRVRTHVRPRFTLHDVAAEVDGLNPLGRIKSACITMHAKIVKVPSKPKTRDWNCEFSGPSTILLFPDWKTEDYSATGATEESLEQLRLILLTDCCAQAQTIASQCPDCGRCTEQLPESRDEDWWKDLSTCRRCIDGEAFRREAMCKPEYMGTFFEDSEPSFEPTRDCPLCRDTNLKRDIWGLLVFPAGGHANTYYRVGTFLSRAEHGGSDHFDTAEEELVTLI